MQVDGELTGNKQAWLTSAASFGAGRFGDEDSDSSQRREKLARLGSQREYEPGLVGKGACTVRSLHIS